jgi:hypothetical protein
MVLLNSGGGKIRIVNSKCGSTLFLRYEKRTSYIVVRVFKGGKRAVKGVSHNYREVC